MGVDRGLRVVSAKVPDGVYEELRRLAEREGVTLSALVKRILAEYVGHADGEEARGGGGGLQPLARRLEELEARVRRLEEALQRQPALGAQRRPRRLVRWVRGVRDPERYFEALSRRMGGIVWVEKERGVYCYAPRGEVEEAVRKANEQGLTPEDADDAIKELAECGLVYHDGAKWRIVD